MCPPRGSPHHFVRDRFNQTQDPNLTPIGRIIDPLGQLRNVADYKLVDRQFATDAKAREAIHKTETALTMLDALEADSVMRAAAIAAIRARFP